METSASIYTPNLAHSYSLGILYVRDWFLSCFNKDYFKAWHVNGKHIITDYKKFSNIGKMYREKPSVVFTPSIDMDYDREMQDSYQGGTQFYLKNYNHRQIFFCDGYSQLSINIREQKMDFAIRCRVETKEQQLNLYNRIMMACRVGYTIKEYKSCDFHIPASIVLNIATKAGFAVENDKVVDLVSFLGYFNNHSKLPIMYKYRASTGNYEFFMRINNVYFHLDIPKDISMDDGETQGHINNNYNVELNVTLKMFVPHFYTYEYVNGLPYTIVEDDSPDSIWTINDSDSIMNASEDEHGWGLFFKTEYECDTDELEMEEIDIDIYDFFSVKHLRDIIEMNNKMNISPFGFINIMVYSGVGEEIPIRMNWDTYTITLVKGTPNLSSVMKFRIYVDRAYYQSVLETMENSRETRIN